MVSGTQIIEKYRKKSLANLVITILLALAGAWFSSQFAGKIVKQDLTTKAREIVFIQSEILTGQLDKYRLLSATLAGRDDIAELFFAKNEKEAANIAKRIAARSAALSGALNIVFIKPDGQIFASGLRQMTEKIDIKSPMMVAALQGRLGRQVNILPQNQRAYSFASAVRKNNKFVGIVAVYVSLDEIEINWSLTEMPIMAVDKNDTIIMSNIADFRLKKLAQISEKSGAYIKVKIDDQYNQYIGYMKSLPISGWELHALANAIPVKFAQIYWAIFSGFLLLLLGFIVQMLFNRQLEMTQKARNERATSLRLERIVRERTRELTKSNIALAREVEERKLAEQQLRKTQNELIQTGKLAALGQMSASLSHEYNQPLSATKTYAQNALKYLQLNRIKEAKENVSRISELVDRMGEISKILRNFARKPNPNFGAISLNQVIKDANEVMKARINEEGAKIIAKIPDEEIYVLAGNVRLQQVIVNLIANALDAMKEQKIAKIELSLTLEKNSVLLHIRDFGPGIKNIDEIFDPFFTTKEVGKGLGLGLSISYNIIKDFGGSLLAKNHPQKGAIFTIKLNRAKNAKNKIKNRQICK